MKSFLVSIRKPIQQFLKFWSLQNKIMPVVQNKKLNTKKVIKEWIELTLCNMLDEIMYLTKNKENRDKTMEIIKKYSTEIYNSQSYDKGV